MTHRKRILFVTGCPRSGTTVLTRLLNCHPDIAVGMERYTRRLLDEKKLTRDLFEPERFATFVEGDCNRVSFDGPVTQIAATKVATAMVVGDKSPNPVEVIKAARRHDDAFLLIIVREPGAVARSYQVRAERAKTDRTAARYWNSDRDHRRAVTDFNRGIAAIRKHLNPSWRRFLTKQVPTLVVSYEDLFSRTFDVDRIFEFLGVQPKLAEGVEAIMGEIDESVITSSSINQYVSMNAKFDDYRAVMHSAATVGHGGLQ